MGTMKRTMKIAGEAWNESKATAGNRVYWHC